MRIMLLQLTTLLFIVSCNQNKFDVKSQEFNRKKSHHFSQKFDDNSVQDEVELNEDVVKFDDPIEIIDIESKTIITESSEKKSMFSGLFSMFSSSDETIDSLDKIINDCEEKLYTSTDAENSQQGAINSLISERNNLLKQLDSLQTTIVQSKRTSNRRLVELESDQRKLKSLIEILSTEIE